MIDEKMSRLNFNEKSVQTHLIRLLHRAVRTVVRGQRSMTASYSVAIEIAVDSLFASLSSF